MYRVIKADLYRHVPMAYSFRALLKGFRSQGFRYMFFFRMVSLTAKNNPLRFFYKLMLRHYRYKYGFQIGGKIGYGFYIGHFGTIVINSAAVIGQNCNIAHGVTIGATRRGKNLGSPFIGNDVWIGTGAVIVGGITIGNNVLIAPNSFVNSDVPANSIVIGNSRVIKHSDTATDGYINNRYVDSTLS